MIQKVLDEILTFTDEYDDIDILVEDCGEYSTVLEGYYIVLKEYNKDKLRKFLKDIQPNEYEHIEEILRHEDGYKAFALFPVRGLKNYTTYLLDTYKDLDTILEHFQLSNSREDSILESKDFTSDEFENEVDLDDTIPREELNNIGYDEVEDKDIVSYEEPEEVFKENNSVQSDMTELNNMFGMEITEDIFSNSKANDFVMPVKDEFEDIQPNPTFQGDNIDIFTELPSTLEDVEEPQEINTGKDTIDSEDNTTTINSYGFDKPLYSEEQEEVHPLDNDTLNNINMLSEEEQYRVGLKPQESSNSEPDFHEKENYTTMSNKGKVDTPSSENEDIEKDKTADPKIESLQQQMKTMMDFLQSLPINSSVNLSESTITMEADNPSEQEETVDDSPVFTREEVCEFIDLIVERTGSNPIIFSSYLTMFDNGEEEKVTSMLLTTLDNLEREGAL